MHPALLFLPCRFIFHLLSVHAPQADLFFTVYLFSETE
jgi:hypothetical protein